MGMKEWLLQWQSLRTRGEIKRAGKAVDASLDQKKALLGYLQAQGHEVDATTSGKKLLRMLLDRSQDAQVRKNPIHLNETFECIYCHEQIALPIEGIRDHCPLCLRGRHVDIVPGDRAANCRARLEPTRFELVGGIVWIEYSCQACVHTYRVRAHSEDVIPHSLSIADLPKISSNPSH